MNNSQTPSLVVDVGGSHINVALMRHDRILDSIVHDSDHTKSFQLCLDLIVESSKELLQRSQIDEKELLGIGLAVPMLVNPASNSISVTAKGKYEDATELDLQGWALDQFKLPITLEVDARAACIGEWVFGAGRGIDDLVYVIIGTGYGSSVILGGRPLRGRQGLSGVRGGHIAVNAGEDRNSCVCPGSGCAESEIGSWSISRNAKKDIRFEASSLSQYNELNYKVLFQEADRNDELAEHLMNECLRYMAVSLLNLTHAYDPEKIILAGGIMKDADIIIPRMNQYLQENIWSCGDCPEVIVATHTENAALYGMHALMSREIEFL